MIILTACVMIKKTNNYMIQLITILKYKIVVTFYLLLIKYLPLLNLFLFVTLVTKWCRCIDNINKE